MRSQAVLVASMFVSTAFAQATWSQLYPAVTPAPRVDAVMDCYEPTGSLLMLFGGSSTGSLLQDCWRLDGTSWSQVAGPLPPARRSAAMVYDSVRQRLVLFGGVATGSKLQDTWEFDGVGWTQRLSVAVPPGRTGHAMAFDRTRGVTVLYGGFVEPVNTIAADLWEWNGTNWTLRSAAVSPGPRGGHMMAFDPERQAVLLHGGSSPIGGGTIPHNDTWTWNGATWQQQYPSTPPPFRYGGRITTDLHRARILLQGGAESFAWEWDGAQWRIVLIASPSNRSTHVIGYDSASRRTVLFGGNIGGPIVDDTWVYQTPLPATVTPFGSGCVGSAGTPALTNAPYSLPWLGDTSTYRVDSIAPGEPGAIFVLSFGTTSPVDLGFVDMPGCELLVPLDILGAAPAVAGVAEWSYAAPMTMSLAGVAWRQQAFPVDAAANVLGLSASNALEVVFGVR